MSSIYGHKTAIERSNQNKIKKAFGGDTDKVLSAKDIGTNVNWKTSFKNEGIAIPISQSELNKQGSEENRRLFEEREAWKEKIKQQEKNMRKKSYSRDTTSDDISIGELNKMLKEKSIARMQVRQLLKKKPEKIDYHAVNKIIGEASVSSAKRSQRLRKERIAAKERRVKIYADRVKRLQKAERSQLKYRRKLSAILNKKKKEETFSSSEIKQMYAQNYRGQNDGNILHAQDFFLNSDNRARSNRDNGNIMQTTNFILGGVKKGKISGGIL